VPELSRFFGIVIRMYVEAGSHHTPHFHAYYQKHAAAFSIDPIDLIAGETATARGGLGRNSPPRTRGKLDTIAVGGSATFD
jgi:hypothetical protein